jgi:hypothetical protein
MASKRLSPCAFDIWLTQKDMSIKKNAFFI